jgi:hypothetical protein
MVPKTSKITIVEKTNFSICEANDPLDKSFLAMGRCK